MTQIILLNGCKGVGKTTAAVNMARTDWHIEPILERAKGEVLNMNGIGIENLPLYDSMKDTPIGDFGGKTFRQLVIEHATLCRKADPCHFAKRWAQDVRETWSTKADLVVVVPDVRFFEEFAAAVDLVGGPNVYLMRIYRPGHDFTGDVGGYIRTDMAVFGNVECSIQNDQDEAFFKLETTVYAHGFVSRARAKGAKP